MRADPDGHTLLLVATPNAINATLYDKLNFNFIRDIAPVASISREPNVIVVNPSVPTRTIPEFIAHAKANPGKTPWRPRGWKHVTPGWRAVSEDGRRQHGPCALSRRAARGHRLDRRPGAIFRCPNVRADRAHQSRKGSSIGGYDIGRSEALPDIPTVAETMPGYAASIWFGLGLPKSAPVQIINKLNQETNAALGDPRIKGRIAELGGTVLTGLPTDFGKFIADETEKWGEVIREANIKLE